MHQRNKIHPVCCDLKSINPARLQKCLDELLSALAEVAKARGMAQVAAAAGLGGKVCIIERRMKHSPVSLRWMLETTNKKQIKFNANIKKTIHLFV